jgi:transposase-like protein
MKKYDDEFKKQAVSKYLDGQSVAPISRDIGVNENTIHKWKKDLLSVNGEVDAEKLARRRFLLKKKAIIHTDRGNQYASVEYRRLLYINGLRQSMSGKGNCYDNAQAESFFSRFKAELLENGKFESNEQAKSEVFSYIEGY